MAGSKLDFAPFISTSIYCDVGEYCIEASLFKTLWTVVLTEGLRLLFEKWIWGVVFYYISDSLSCYNNDYEFCLRLVSYFSFIGVRNSLTFLGLFFSLKEVFKTTCYRDKPSFNNILLKLFQLNFR